MTSTYLQLRLIHFAFVLGWFLYVGLVIYMGLPEKSESLVLPVAFGVVALSTISVGNVFRQKLIVVPANELLANPEDAAMLRRWRSGNLVSFAFAESIMLFGVALRFLGERWKVAAIFFAVGLVLLILWRPRPISKPQ